MENENIFSSLPLFKEKESDTYVRYIGSNILKVFDYEKDPQSRCESLRHAFSLLGADVMSLQEVCTTWRGPLKIKDVLSSIGYATAPLESDRCCVPVVYNESAITLIDTGFDTYRAADEIGAFKCYKWALLEQKSTKKRFIGISTHLIAGKYPEVRKQSAIQLSSAISELEQKYGVPVVVCGDFNSLADSFVYRTMQSGLFSARESAPVKVNMEYCTENVTNNPPKIGEIVIDHCFYSKQGIIPKRFETVITPFSCAYSDHVPICFDFELV